MKTERAEKTRNLVKKDVIKALLVEDDKSDRLLAERVLARYPQCAKLITDTAGSLSKAVEYLRNKEYDIILL